MNMSARLSRRRIEADLGLSPLAWRRGRGLVRRDLPEPRIVVNNLDFFSLD